jgi:hypothetical protein
VRRGTDPRHPHTSPALGRRAPPRQLQLDDLAQPPQLGGREPANKAPGVLPARSGMHTGHFVARFIASRIARRNVVKVVGLHPSTGPGAVTVIAAHHSPTRATGFDPSSRLRSRTLVRNT